MDINATLLGQTIAFALFIWFTMKYVWPPLMQAIEERQGKIAEGLAASERGQKDLEIAQEKASSMLKEAKQEASQIVELANKRASEIVEAAKSDARVEADRVIAGAQAEIDQSVNRGREQLRGEVAALSVAGAEKILSVEVSQDKHQKMLDDLIASL